MNQNYESQNRMQKNKDEVFSVLLSLERKNELRDIIFSNNVNKINQTISSSIPKLKRFYPVIFNKTTNVTVLPNINDKRNVAVIEYLISGEYGKYDPRILKIFLWD
ncbi:MAG: hypothetical protein QXM68_03110 [Candidatus Aenigmatarchaeota archaeon]